MIFSEFLEKNKTNLDGLIKMSKGAADRVDYIQGGGGNTSVKLTDGLMAIKASGFSMGQITHDNAYAVLNATMLRDFFLHTDPDTLDYIEKIGSAKTKEATVSIDGLEQLRPSVEAGFHSILGKYVLHSHSVYANMLACSAEGRTAMAQAFSGSDYSFGMIPYVDPGSTLTFSVKQVVDQVTKETGKYPAVLIMENHGIIAHADTADEATAIHEDANRRLASFFGVNFSDFPQIKLKEEGGKLWSNTPWLTERLRTGRYDEATFMEKSLYPDQLVFLAKNVKITEDSDKLTAGDVKCTIDLKTGEICYNANETEAMVIEQTLCCVLFVLENIEKQGFTVQLMDSASKDFIAGWESEAYRKSLLKD